MDSRWSKYNIAWKLGNYSSNIGRSAYHHRTLVFDDFDNFIEYLNTKAFAGDAIHIWNFSEVCKDDNTITNGKCPAEDGRIPKKGAY